MSETALYIGDAETGHLLDEIQQRFLDGVVEPQEDRRQKVRRPFQGRIMFQPCDRQGRMLGPPLDSQACDLSLWGLCFTTSKRLEVGQYLGLSFPMTTRGVQRTVLMLGEVRHVRAAINGDWSIGCAFRETLSSGEST